MTLFFSIRPSLGLLPVLAPLDQYMTSPALDAALLSSSRAGADLGRTSDTQTGFDPTNAESRLL